MEQRKPSIGRIVSYSNRRGPGPENQTAIVTHVNKDGTVALRVSFGTFDLPAAVYDVAGARGTWHWPPPL